MFCVDDGLVGQVVGLLDLVLCNLLFYQQQVVGDFFVWCMFFQVCDVLVVGGELWIVGNCYLGYYVKFKWLFCGVEQVVVNLKFVILKVGKQLVECCWGVYVVEYVWIVVWYFVLGWMMGQQYMVCVLVVVQLCKCVLESVVEQYWMVVLVVVQGKYDGFGSGYCGQMFEGIGGDLGYVVEQDGDGLGWVVFCCCDVGGQVVVYV